MTPRRFWPAAIAAVVVLVATARWLVAEPNFIPVAATIVATFAGACIGAALLLMLRGNPMWMVAATLGRSVVSVLGVVLVWLLLEPAPKPVLGAFAIGYVVFLALETALAWSMNQTL